MNLNIRVFYQPLNHIIAGIEFIFVASLIPYLVEFMVQSPLLLLSLLSPQINKISSSVTNFLYPLTNLQNTLRCIHFPLWLIKHTISSHQWHQQCSGKSSRSGGIDISISPATDKCLPLVGYSNPKAFSSSLGKMIAELNHLRLFTFRMGSGASHPGIPREDSPSLYLYMCISIYLSLSIYLSIYICMYL